MQQITEKDAYWSDLLMSLSEGRAESIAALNRMDAVEFWHYFLSWQKRQKAMAEAYQK